MKSFEPNGFALEPGIRLLEASAGTGKTFALAHLVLRLVAERGLAVRQLLVVTFTEAAVAELRDRIARRLQETLALLERPQRDGAEVAPGRPDAVLREWLAAWCQGRPEAERELLRGRLLLALEELDAADITTIHGFCARTLQRQALEAGRPAELRLETPGDGLVQEVVHDYWQQQVLALPVELLAGLEAARVQPDQLVRLLESLDGDPALRLDPLPEELQPPAILSALLPGLLARRWQTFVGEWQGRGQALEADFRAAAAAWREMARGRGAKVSTTPYAAKPSKDRVALLQAWIDAQPAGGDYGAV
ncbi:MAG: UvrD-helicase domain-containing protein, partial [Cyanobium sp.]